MAIVELPTPVFCGIDWAEGHHDIALVDADGNQLAKMRISDDAAGFTQLTDLLTEHGDTDVVPIPRGDRDVTRASRRLPAGNRAAGLREQPDGGCPLPRPPLRRPQEVGRR
ncbi:transposase [Streptomyces sp. NPDC005549]|uniref:IS110 family transposase n=1 Tax=Streptomyces sp. NPDC005549 TaxID=3154888 RepID=UPI0033B8983A